MMKEYPEDFFDWQPKVENYQPRNKNMITQRTWWKDVLSALVSSVLVAVLGYVATLTDVFTIDFHQLINIAVLTGVTSLLKALLTTSQGNFVGAVPIK